MEHIKKMNVDDKAVVFSQFLGMMDLLAHDFAKNNIKFVVKIIFIIENGRIYASKGKGQNYFLIYQQS